MANEQGGVFRFDICWKRHKNITFGFLEVGAHLGRVLYGSLSLNNTLTRHQVNLMLLVYTFT